MAKNIRITKANQIAINEIVRSKNDFQHYDNRRLFASKNGDEELAELYGNQYETALTKWSAQCNLLAKMNNMDFCDLVSSANYRTMVDAASY